MNLVITGHKFQYEIENLVRLFFPTEKIITTAVPNGDNRVILTSLSNEDESVKIYVSCKFEGKTKCNEKIFSLPSNEPIDYEREMAVLLMDILTQMTGYYPPWGILTGVRPAKLMAKLIKDTSKDEAVDYFINKLKVSKQKSSLALMVANAQQPIVQKSKPNSFSLYVSIPFCPTRCSYCSFVSHSNERAKKLIPKYVDLLCREIKITAEIAQKNGLSLSSIYIGGGTPTVLQPEMLKKVTDEIYKNFMPLNNIEYTIEAGRPDTVTKEKLDVILNSGATRISINPQTFNDSVLEEIGRKHTTKMTYDAFNLARKCGFNNINMDIIAGLPTDSLQSYENTLDCVLALNPENITVHTLSLKRSSSLVTDGGQLNDAKTAAQMLNRTFIRLSNADYYPYYMYRQSKCLGNLENVGWTKKSYECEYNIYMMEECHTILGAGAGAVTKLKDPYSGEIERIFNYKYPYEYINGFDEMIRRKKRISEFYRNRL